MYKYRVPRPKDSEKRSQQRALCVSRGSLHLYIFPIGFTNNKRNLATIFTVRGSKIRVISARDMSKKERRFYEKTIREDSTI